MLNHAEQVAILAGCLIPSLVIAYTDTRHYLIPNLVTLPVFLAGLVAAVYRGDLLDALLGAALGFGILFLLAVLGGAGGGDVKYAAGLGIWFGAGGVLLVLFMSFAFGAVWGMAKMLRNGELKERAKTFFRGIFLRVVCNVKGTMLLPRLPEDPSAPAPPDAVPFGACLALAAWAIWVAAII